VVAKYSALKERNPVNAVLDVLVDLSRSPRPAPWDAAVAPLARRLEAARLQHAAQRAEFIALAERLSLVQPQKMQTLVTPEALKQIGRLKQIGTSLLSALDASFEDVTKAYRAATSAVHEPDYASALERLGKYVPLWEGAVDTVSHLVTEAHRVLARLADTKIISDVYVLPPRPEGGDIAVSTGGGAR